MTDNGAPPWTGGCACGRIRYQASVEPTGAGYCHCRLCQRTTAAPMVAFADVPLSAWRYLAGEPRIFASSPRGERRFCPHCGTQIEYRDAGAPLSLSVNLATLDDPGRVTPGFHIWTDSAASWTRFDDGLPRFRQGHGGDQGF